MQYILRDRMLPPRGWWGVIRRLRPRRERRVVFVEFGEPWPPVTSPG
jgi:hypothetical protein